MRSLRGAALGLAALLAASCATPARVAVNPRADFSRVDRVAVVSFGGPAGDLAADMLTQSLLARGANVVERQQLNVIAMEQRLAASGMLDSSTVKRIGKVLGVDAIFIGSVSRSIPSQSYVVTGSQRGILTTVTPVAGASVRSDGGILGVPDSQVVTSAANASVVSRLIDVETGSILWSASMSYEGFDVQSAMASIADAFAHSLVPVWPALGTAKR